jgi:tRNA-dependent cyclodipeptide synthase
MDVSLLKPTYPEDGVGCLIGFSLGNNFYSARRLGLYFKWCGMRFPKLGVLIGDWIYAFTHSYYHQLPLQESQRIAQAMGDGAAIMCERVAAEVGRSLTIIRWKDLTRHTTYTRLFHALKREYVSSETFRIAVTNQTQISLKRPMFSGMDSNSTKRIPLLHQYVLHEVAGLILVAEYMVINGKRPAGGLVDGS